MYLAKTAIRLFPWAPGEDTIKIKEKKLQQDVTIYQIMVSTAGENYVRIPNELPELPKAADSLRSVITLHLITFA